MNKLSQTMLAPAAVPTDGGSSSAEGASFADGAGLDFSPPPVGNIDDKTIVCAMQDRVSLPEQEKTGNSPSPPQKISSEQEHFEWEQYLEGLPAMELRKRFPKEASSHRNMLARGKKGFVIHSDFRTFRDFLRHMGKAPTASATVDRIDPNDPEYAPGKVRWADKATQASNKTNTHVIVDPHTGKAWTVPQLAKHLNLTQSAVRKRREAGWTDDEIINGKPSSSTHPASSEPAPTSKQAYLDSGPRPLYSEHVDIHLIGRSALWMAIADKFPPTWRDVNHIERQLFEWFPAIKERYFDLDFIPPPRIKYPEGRWKQLFDMFPIDIEHLSAINDYFISERVPGGRAIVEARRREERRALARKEAEGRAKWEEWEYTRNMNEVPDLSPKASAHLYALGEHPLDAWKLYVEMQDDEEVRVLDFEGFVLRLRPDEDDAPSDDDQLRRNLALEVAPPLSPEDEIADVEDDFDPADCAAPPEVDDEDDDENEGVEEDRAATRRDEERDQAFEDAFRWSAEDEEDG